MPSGAREEIFERLERSRPPQFDAPPTMTPPPSAIDPIAGLRDQLAEAGGTLQMASRNDWPSQIAWPAERSELVHVYSSRPEVSHRGVGESAQTDHDLAPLDLCILSGEFAVVESGAVWQTPATARERVAALLATHLILVVDAHEIVPTLIEAYARIPSEPTSFGWFLCGPSKTADIEQSLVLGAHGPCTMSLVLLEG